MTTRSWLPDPICVNRYGIYVVYEGVLTLMFVCMLQIYIYYFSGLLTI